MSMDIKREINMKWDFISIWLLIEIYQLDLK